MTFVTDTWRQLVQRRLWPLALVLIGALVAVPVLLAKHPEPAAPAPAAAATVKTTDTNSYVKLVSDDGGDTAKRKRVLGAQKDPFEPAPLPKVKKKKKKAKAVKAEATATPTPEASSDSGSSGTTDTPVTTPVEPTVTPTPVKTAPKGSLKVRFGKVDGTKATSTLERLKALPSANSPVLVFTGLENHGKTAVFMLSGDVTVEGDGTCEPAADSCETLKLHAGDTEFLTVTGTGSTDGQYELDLERINQ
jgi:hypothetical protein